MSNIALAPRSAIISANVNVTTCISLYHTISVGSIGYVINSLCPSDAIWGHRSGSTLAQVMACCLMAPSHYLDQCWIIIKGALQHSTDSSFTSGHELNVFRDYTFKIITKSPRGQWVNISWKNINTCSSVWWLAVCWNENPMWWKKECSCLW